MPKGPASNAGAASTLIGTHFPRVLAEPGVYDHVLE